MSNRNTIRSRLVAPEPGQDPELLAHVCYDVLRGIKEHVEVKPLLAGRVTQSNDTGAPASVRASLSRRMYWILKPESR